MCVGRLSCVCECADGASGVTSVSGHFPVVECIAYCLWLLQTVRVMFAMVVGLAVGETRMR